MSLTLDPIVVPFVSTLSVVAGLSWASFPPSTRRERGSEAPSRTTPNRDPPTVCTSVSCAQFALLMVLLATTGLIVQSHRYNANRTDRGYRVSDVGAFRVAPGLNGYGHARTRVLVEGIGTALSAEPGVVSVATGTVNTAAGRPRPSRSPSRESRGDLTPIVRRMRAWSEPATSARSGSSCWRDDPSRTRTLPGRYGSRW